MGCSKCGKNKVSSSVTKVKRSGLKNVQKVRTVNGTRYIPK